MAGVSCPKHPKVSIRPEVVQEGGGKLIVWACAEGDEQGRAHFAYAEYVPPKERE